MKVTFISPRWPDKGLSTLSLFKNLPSVALLQLASLTPQDFDLEIINEELFPIDFNATTDLIALTAMTHTASRAYEIATEFRKRGIPTIMGGVHASERTNEALRHVDSVVVGEADEIWPEILQNFYLTKSLERVYIAPTPADLDFKKRRYISKTRLIKPFPWLPLEFKLAHVQATRGCPVGCDFCSVTKFNGKKIRHKSIDYLLTEIFEEKERNDFDLLFFVDDNIVVQKNFAKDLFTALVKSRINIKWFSQTDVRITDPDVLDLALESGLSMVYLGLESINESNLRSISSAKRVWRKRYEETIKRLKSNGVIIIGSFIFGRDADTPDTFIRTVEWAIENRIDFAAFTISTPLPGTALFAKLEQEGRITDTDWSKYDVTNSVVKHPTMSREEIENGLRWAYKEFYSHKSIVRRLFANFTNYSLKDSFLKIMINLDIRSILKTIPGC